MKRKVRWNILMTCSYFKRSHFFQNVLKGNFISLVIFKLSRRYLQSYSWCEKKNYIFKQVERSNLLQWRRQQFQCNCNTFFTWLGVNSLPSDGPHILQDNLQSFDPTTFWHIPFSAHFGQFVSSSKHFESQKKNIME